MVSQLAAGKHEAEDQHWNCRPGSCSDPRRIDRCPSHRSHGHATVHEFSRIWFLWWYYGLSTVELQDEIVTGWANHGDLNGRTTCQSVYKGSEESISYAAVSQYATTLTITKTQTTAIWRLPRIERVQSTVRLTSGSSYPFVAENGSYYG